MSKNKIIILSEGNYSDSQSQFAHATGQTGKDYSFVFVSVDAGRYCDALLEIETIIDAGGCIKIYVVTNTVKSKRFMSKLRRNLNRCIAENHYKKIAAIPAFHIDMKKGKTEDFFKKQTRDKKPALKKVA